MKEFKKQNHIYKTEALLNQTTGLVCEKIASNSETPWLVPTANMLKKWLSIFPSGQFVINDEFGEPVSIQMFTKINWDGDIQKLSADIKAKGIKEAFVPDGNTLVMWVETNPLGYIGTDLQLAFVNNAKYLGQKEGVEHILCLLKPSEYGIQKAKNPDVKFWEYCQKNSGEGLSPTEWLSDFEESGIKIIKPAYKACQIDNITLGISLNEIYEKYINSYKPELWGKGDDLLSLTTPDGGVWYLDPDHEPKAVYVGDYVWGMIF